MEDFFFQSSSDDELGKQSDSECDIEEGEQPKAKLKRELAASHKLQALYKKLHELRARLESVSSLEHPQKRLLIISLDLPISLVRLNEGEHAKWRCDTQSETKFDLRCFSDCDNPCLWIGWPGVEVEPREQLPLSEALVGHRFCPVFLEEAYEFYFLEGFFFYILLYFITTL